MGRVSIVVAALAALGLAGAAHADREITMDMIRTTLPLHGPVLLVNGGKPDFMLESSGATFDMIDALPVFYGSRHGAGHTATVDHPGDGEFANVASNWLLWTLKGDDKAGESSGGELVPRTRSLSGSAGPPILSRAFGPVGPYRFAGHRDRRTLDTT
jgi:hypothetical protein